jgi:arsenate reductase
MTFNVLILCTGNSARSVMSEAIINKRGEGRFKAYSAGSQPTGAVNPVGAKLLASKGYDVSQYRSKSWDEFSAEDAPVMDAVITVCDNAAGETCPIWPGVPLRMHWGFPDPAATEGTEEEKLASFSEIYDAIDIYIEKFVAFSVETMDPDELKTAMQAIADAD